MNISVNWKCLIGETTCLLVRQWMTCSSVDNTAPRSHPQDILGVFLKPFNQTAHLQNLPQRMRADFISKPQRHFPFKAPFMPVKVYSCSFLSFNSTAWHQKKPIELKPFDLWNEVSPSTNLTKWTSKINIPTYSLNKFLMVPRSQKILPTVAWTWIFLLLEYHSFITSIVLYYMVCFPIIPHCCLLSSPSAIGITFYLLWVQGQLGSFIDSDVFPLVVRGIEEVKWRERERERESVPSAVVYNAEWEGGTAGTLSTQSNCVTVSLLPGEKGHALCLQSP